MIERYLTEKEAAQQIGFSLSYFQKLRWRGGGPEYRKIGRAVRYREADLVAWIERHPIRGNTSEAA